MKNMNKKVLSIAVSSAMTFAVCQSVSVQASDIEIYKTADKGKVTLMMMVDLSSSMTALGNSSLFYDYGLGDDLCRATTGRYTGEIGQSSSEPGNDDITSRLIDTTKKLGLKKSKLDGSTYQKVYCDVDISRSEFQRDINDIRVWTNNKDENNTASQKKYSDTPLKKSVYNFADDIIYGWQITQGTTSKTAVEKQCTSLGGTTYRCFSRLTRLKDAFFAILNDPKWNDQSQANTISMGLGHIGGSPGKILVQANPMTSTQIQVLKTAVESLSNGSYTQTGTGYAVAGSNLLGVNVNSNPSNEPMNSGAETSCRGDGIYFLTDGTPLGTTNSHMVTWANTGLVGSGKDNISISSPENITAGNEEWQLIFDYSKSLRRLTTVTNYKKNPIKTATVGFGARYLDLQVINKQVKNTTGIIETKKFYNCDTTLDFPFWGKERTNQDPSALAVKNTCKWGQKTPKDPKTDLTYSDWNSANSGYGEGGFYPASSKDDVVNSVFEFVDELKPIIPEVATGSPVVPVDNLNPLQLQPYGYYASFTPTPQESYQLWAGNLNKYHVKDGMLYGSDKSTLLLKLTGEFNTEAQGLWAGGVKGRLPLGTGVDISNNNYSKRTIYTNRKLTGTTAAEDTSLHKVNLESLFSVDTSKGLFVSDPKKNYWLNALGYNVAEGATDITLTNLPTVENRQVGAVMHSTPILLTQQGKIGIDTTTKQIVSTDRQDYLLFGSTQGILHVVKAGQNDTDTNGGEEVFAFIPNEMMENNSKAFLPKEATNLGKTNLFYGIDAPWIAYTQYVTKSDGTSTVSDSGRKVDDNTDALALKGLQWVYGGLRMGGRSYYALDLSDIDEPSLKFHINPAAEATGPLSYMGRSWSKPTIAYVNWGGERKLVMFVGGGYDMGYEAENYDQSTKQGAGVYMFDANNGDLLWWASANATASSSASTNSGVISIKNDDLKYSVVSQINAVDRNSDGLVDHLYFGDLGGQAFRIDLDNNAATKGAFTKRVFRLLNLHVAGGASPRFYEAPSFSIANGIDGKFATVAFSSGNRSSPLAGVEASKTTISANDGVFVVYDNDVARSDLYTTTTLKTPEDSTSLVTLDLDKNEAKAADGSLTGGVPQKDGSKYNPGWQYLYSSTAGTYKGMNGLYALDGYLYVNVYHKDGVGISGACNSGVRGDSYVYQFCLPLGRCPFTLPSMTAGSSSKTPYRSKLGAGILGTTLGVNSGGFSNVVTNTTDCTDSANKNKVECQIFDSKVGLKNLRWYESR